MMGTLLTCFLTLGLTVLAPEGDSPIVAKSRKKLETPITLEAKDQPLQDLAKELGELADLRLRIDPAVPKHKSFSVNAKEKPLKEVLDEMFKGSGLGYYVHRKQNANDRYEGYIDIVQGDQRGDDTAKKEEKGAKDSGKKPTSTKPSGGKTEGKNAPDAEKLAAGKLKLAKMLLDDGQKKEAKESLEEIVAKYPKTKAGGEAKALLEKLKK